MRVLQASAAAELGPADVAVVIDVLRATTSACVLLHRGARRVLPVETPEAATELARTLSSPLLVGERDRGALPGFVDNSPSRLFRLDLRGRDVVFTTTNGTRVILACQGAGRVVVGGLVNATALAQVLDDAESVAVVACGWKGGPASDDDAVAAYVAELIAGEAPERESVVEAVLQSVSARRLSENGKRADVDLAIQFDAFPVVPVLAHKALVDYNDYGDRNGHGSSEDE